MMAQIKRASKTHSQLSESVFGFESDPYLNKKRNVKSVSLKFGTLNVGTITGKSRELPDMMERRERVLFVHARDQVKGQKHWRGYKLFYHGADGKINGVGVILKEEYARNLVKVMAESDRLICVKVVIEGEMLAVGWKKRRSSGMSWMG